MDIIEQAKTYLEVPYLHQGRSRNGIDCLGLVVCVAQDLNLLPEDYEEIPYSRDPEPEKLIEGLSSYLTPISLEEVGHGDILLFRIRQDPQHMGFVESYNGIPYLIHSLSSIDGGGEVVRHILDQKFLDRRVMGFRL